MTQVIPERRPLTRRTKTYTERFHVMLSESMKARIDEAAELLDTTSGEIVRQCIDHGIARLLKEHGV